MMSEWTTHTLNDVCLKIYSGGTPSTKHSEYWNGDINWLSSGETSNKYIYETDRKISKLGVSKSSTQLAHKGDTVVASAGQGYTRGQASYLMIDTYVNQSVIVFHANTELIDNKYLFYNLGNRYEELRQLSDGTSTRGGLSGWIVKRMEINLPPIDEQKQIVGILSAIDDKIELNTAINENLEQQAQALFKAWFVDFEPFGGVMPDDWSKCILDSMFSLIIKGITPKYNEHSAQLVINQKCVRNHQIDLSLARCHEPKKVNEKWLQYGDIVVNSTGTGTLGRAAQVLFTPNNMTVDSHVTIIRASKQEYIYYLGLWATSHEHDFEMLQTGSTGQTDLPRERLKQMQIVLPSDSILSSFSKVIKPIADIRIQKQQENQRLSALRDTLLPKLMNGEIDVSAVKI